MLTRKHFIELASIIKSNSVELLDETIDMSNANSNWYINKEAFINDLMGFLKRDNINFKYSMFEDACKIKEEERRF